MYYSYVRPRAIPFSQSRTQFVRLQPFSEPSLAPMSSSHKSSPRTKTSAPVNIPSLPLSLTTNSSSLKIVSSIAISHRRPTIRKPSKTKESNGPITSATWSLPTEYKESVTKLQQLLAKSAVQTPVSVPSIVSAYLLTFDDFERKPKTFLKTNKSVNQSRHPLCKAVDALFKGNSSKVLEYIQVFYKSRSISNNLNKEFNFQKLIQDEESSKVLLDFVQQSREVAQKEPQDDKKKVSKSQSNSSLIKDICEKVDVGLTVFDLQSNQNQSNQNQSIQQQLPFVCVSKCSIKSISEMIDSFSGNQILIDHDLVENGPFAVEYLETPLCLQDYVQTDHCLKVGPINVEVLTNNVGIIASKLGEIFGEWFQNFVDPSSSFFELFDHFDICPATTPCLNRNISFKSEKRSVFSSYTSLPNFEKYLVTWLVNGDFSFLFVPCFRPRINHSETNLINNNCNNSTFFGSNNIDKSSDGAHGSKFGSKFDSRMVFTHTVIKLSVPVVEFEIGDDVNIDFFSEFSDEEDDHVMDHVMNDDVIDLYSKISLNFGRSIGTFSLKSLHDFTYIDSLISKAKSFIKNRKYKHAFSLLGTITSLSTSTITRIKVLIYRSLLFTKIYLKSLALEDAQLAMQTLEQFRQGLTENDVQTLNTIKMLMVEAYLAQYHATSSTDTSAVSFLERALEIQPRHPYTCFYYARHLKLSARKNLQSSRDLYHKALLIGRKGLSALRLSQRNSRQVQNLERSLVELLADLYLSAGLYVYSAQCWFSLIQDENFKYFDSDMSSEPRIDYLLIFLRIIEIFIAGNFPREALSFIAKLEVIFEKFQNLKYFKYNNCPLSSILLFLRIKAHMELKHYTQAKLDLLLLSQEDSSSKLYFLTLLNSALVYCRLDDPDSSQSFLSNIENFNDYRTLIIQGCNHLINNSNSKAFISFNKALTLRPPAPVECLIHCFFVFFHNKNLHSLEFSTNVHLTADYIGLALAVSGLQENGSKSSSKKSYHLTPWNNWSRVSMSIYCNNQISNQISNQNLLSLWFILICLLDRKDQQGSPNSFSKNLLAALLFYWTNQAHESVNLLSRIINPNSASVEALLYAVGLLEVNDVSKGLEILSIIKKSSRSPSLRMRALLTEAMFFRKGKSNHLGVNNHSDDVLGDVTFDEIDVNLLNVSQLDDITYFFQGSLYFRDHHFYRSRELFSKVLHSNCDCFPAVFARFLSNLHLCLSECKKKSCHFLKRAQGDVIRLKKFKRSVIPLLAEALITHVEAMSTLNFDQVAFKYSECINFLSSDKFSKISQNLSHVQKEAHQEIKMACLRRRASVLFYLGENLASLNDVELFLSNFEGKDCSYFFNLRIDLEICNDIKNTINLRNSFISSEFQKFSLYSQTISQQLKLYPWDCRCFLIKSILFLRECKFQDSFYLVSNLMEILGSEKEVNLHSSFENFQLGSVAKDVKFSACLCQALNMSSLSDVHSLLSHCNPHDLLVISLSGQKRSASLGQNGFIFDLLKVLDFPNNYTFSQYFAHQNYNSLQNLIKCYRESFLEFIDSFHLNFESYQEIISDLENFFYYISIYIFLNLDFDLDLTERKVTKVLHSIEMDDFLVNRYGHIVCPLLINLALRNSSFSEALLILSRYNDFKCLELVKAAMKRIDQ
ncbi:hypothetical protein P9112_009182 [Eukaryota sp. TZLM1-RC]